MRDNKVIVSISHNEDGFTIAELLCTIVILSIVVPLLMGFIVSNAKMIELNTIQTEAIDVREEIREWMSYKATSQDIADLNPYVLATTGHQPAPITIHDSKEEEIRAGYLILDESGIPKDISSGKAQFGETVPTKVLVDDDGKEISGSTRTQTHQVMYDGRYDFSKLNIADISSDDKQKYVGMYVGEGAQRHKTQFAVLAEAAPKAITMQTATSTAENYDSGILVTLRIYDFKTGKELTNTQFHWVADD